MPLITRCNAANHTTVGPQYITVGPFPTASRLLRLEITIVFDTAAQHILAAVIHGDPTASIHTVRIGDSIFDRTGWHYPYAKVIRLPRPPPTLSPWTYPINRIIPSGPMYLHIMHNPEGLPRPVNDSIYVVTAHVPNLITPGGPEFYPRPADVA